jgi:Spy/CpxP family protein refolding chaperone
VRALAADAGRLRAESLHDCVESVIEVRRVLTPEQSAKLIGACCAPRTE